MLPAGGPPAKPKAAPKLRTRRRRDNKQKLADTYAELHKRIPKIATAEALNTEFADKELRILMSQNGMLINDLDPVSDRYVEKTKVRLCLCLVFPLPS